MTAALVLLAWTSVQLPAHAAPPGDPYFDRLGPRNGLHANSITELYQDRAGFIWVGTRNGLALYDGYGFVTLEHDVTDPTSISDNAVREVYEDDRGNIWIGTNTGGLNRLDRTNWTFEHFRHDSADPHSLSHDSVYAIRQDRSGALWIGTQVGLNRFDYVTGRFERFLADENDPTSLSNDYVTAIHEDPDGRLWVGTFGGGLNLRDRDSSGFHAYRHVSGDMTSLSDDRVLAITTDDDNNLWVGTHYGLNLMQQGKCSFRQFTTNPHRPGTPDAPVVSVLALDPDGQLWIGTTSGLNRFDRDRATVVPHIPLDEHPGGLTVNSIVSLLVDRAGTLWVGSWSEGLGRLRRAVGTIVSSETDPSLPGFEVATILEDRRGGLWVGSLGRGLYRRDPGEREFRHYLGRDERNPNVGAFRVAEDRSGAIWAGTQGGLNRLDPETDEVVQFRHDPKDPSSLGPGWLTAILEDSRGRLWVGTGQGGLQQVDAEVGIVARFLHDPEDPESLSDNYVTALWEDRYGVIWVGTRSGGLNAFHPRTGRFGRYLPVPGEEDRISHHFVTSILEDSKGRLWVGTAGGGLNRAELDADGGRRFTRIGTADGLINDNVKGIVEDVDGSLWISTARGLSRFKPDTGEFASLQFADGLPAAEFAVSAAVRGREALYFGSVKGVVAIPTGTPFPAPSASPTIIRKIRNSTVELQGNRPVWELDWLEIPYGEWLSLEFAVLDFNLEHNHRYAYRLGGETGDWVDIGSRREVTLTRLEPGSYEFSLKGRNSQGVWSAAVTPLRVDVIPPVWMTWWFRSLLLASILVFASVAHRVRMSAVRKRNRELIELHRQRERARRKLRIAYDRLRRVTRRLEVAKEDERKRIAGELHDEMGQALTAVKINLQLLPGNPDPDWIAERSAETVALVDRMIQKIRDLSLTLRPALLDELGLAAALRAFAESQARLAGIEVRVDASPDVGGLPPEIEIAAFRMVQESITNVIRHAGAKQATVTVRRVENDLKIVVRDDGRGFDVSEAMERAGRGRAIGLAGIQERVHGLGGEFAVESSPGEGTAVHVCIPTENG
jgi:signal transduction histidine kinase/ligand-binding sensor domain-containing protein